MKLLFAAGLTFYIFVSALGVKLTGASDEQNINNASTGKMLALLTSFEYHSNLLHKHSIQASIIFTNTFFTCCS